MLNTVEAAWAIHKAGLQAAAKLQLQQNCQHSEHATGLHETITCAL
jgi:hypothetical protein